MEKMGKGNNENLRLSVAMCTYNGELYIKEQLESIINQALPVNEIIICDDGSTDNTIPIILNIIEKTTNIKIELYFNSIKLGVVKNFEKAISLCTGDIIFLSDQDDIWLDNKSTIIFNEFNINNNINIIFTDAYIIDENNNINKYTLFDAVDLRGTIKEAWLNGFEFEITNACGNKVTGATVALRKTYIKDIIPFNIETKKLHDEQLAICAIIQSCIKLLPQPLIKYRIHSNNTIGLKNSWIFKSQIPPQYDIKYIIYEPRPVNVFFNKINEKYNNPKIQFHKKRYKNYSSIIGKFVLLSSIGKYFKHYRKAWWNFYFSDITYGIFPF